MRATATSVCHCGSGRTPARCHDAPRRERRRRRRELHALGEAHDVAHLFPSLRPSDEAIGAFADEAAAALGPGRPIPVGIVEDGLALLGPAERRRIVESWAGPHRDRWRVVCAEVGDVGLVERVFAASAVRAAIVDRLLPPRELVAMFDGGGLRRSPCAALSLVLLPDTMPFAGLPTASSTLAEGCALVAEDEGLARATAAEVLVVYATQIARREERSTR